MQQSVVIKGYTVFMTMSTVTPAGNSNVPVKEFG